MHEQGTAVIQGLSPKAGKELRMFSVFIEHNRLQLLLISRRSSQKYRPVFWHTEQLMCRILISIAHSVPEIGAGIAGRPRSRSSIPDRGKKCFSSPWRPDRLWSQGTGSILLENAARLYVPYRQLQQQSVRNVVSALRCCQVSSIIERSVREACVKVLRTGVYTFFSSTFTSLLVVILVYCWFKSMRTVQKPYCIEYSQ
jgi:hypothetical protein